MIFAAARVTLLAIVSSILMACAAPYIAVREEGIDICMTDGNEFGSAIYDCVAIR